MSEYIPNQINKEQLIEIIREKMLSKHNNITEDQRKKFKKSLSSQNGNNVKDFLVELLLIETNKVNHLEYELYQLRKI
jgi:hypothetical protein